MKLHAIDCNPIQKLKHDIQKIGTKGWISTSEKLKPFIIKSMLLCCKLQGVVTD